MLLRTDDNEPCTPRLPTAWSPQKGHLAEWCQPTGPTVRRQSRYAEDSRVHPTCGIDCEILRKDIWPNGVNLQNQLYGDRADMQRTAEYIRRAGWTVMPSGRTSGQMVSTYRTNCTVTEQICRGQ
jgi:hypothetical protein